MECDYDKIIIEAIKTMKPFAPIFEKLERQFDTEC